MDKLTPPKDIADKTPEKPEQQGAGFSFERECGSHAPQLAACNDKSQWKHLMCSRQSGKSWADCFMLFEKAVNSPGSTNIFLGLRGTAVKLAIWTPVWRALCDRYEVPASAHNQTSMMTTFENGSRVVFGGTDDLDNIKKYLGNRLGASIFIVDEAQDQKTPMLRYLLRQLLPPMLSDESQIVMSGVLPDAPVGFFYEQAAEKPLSEAHELAVSKGWSHHEWARAANVHTPEAMAVLARYKSDFNIPDDDPQVLRDWFLIRVWDAGATAYGFVEERNTYAHVTPEWISSISLPPGRIMAAAPPFGATLHLVGIDPAGLRDRYAIEVLSFGEATDRIWQTFEWITAKAADPLQSQANDVLREIKRRYPNIIGVVRDHGSAAITDDTMLVELGLVVEPAIKADLRARVQRMRDLVRAGRMLCMKGSALAEDFAKARWSLDQSENGDVKWRWDSAHHPDAADAAVYVLPKYFGRLPPPPGRAETPDEMVARLAAEAFRPKGEFQYGPGVDFDALETYGGTP